MKHRTYVKRCRNPKCNKEFTTSRHNQLYCKPECRISLETNYKLSRVDRPYFPPKLNETQERRFICSKCESKMELKYTDKGHKLYLYCSKPHCTNKVDYDRYLNEGRNSKKVKKEVM